jgi:type VI secretion system protein ImpA
MCDKFWDSVHPRPREGESLSTTFAQLAGLNGVDSEGTLIAPLMSIPITGPSNSRVFSCADYLDAVDLERKDPMIRAQRVQNGAPSTELIDRAVNETNVDFFRNLLEDVQQSMEAFNEFNTWLSVKVADVPDGSSVLPPSSSIRDTLNECLRLIKVITRNVLDTGEEETGMTVVSDGQAGGLAASRVQTREEAFRALLQVSDYFRRAEPHSPVSYALEQVVRWGRMSLPELLAELVEDQSSRREIYKRTGIPQPPQQD